MTGSQGSKSVAMFWTTLLNIRLENNVEQQVHVSFSINLRVYHCKTNSISSLVLIIWFWLCLLGQICMLRFILFIEHFHLFYYCPVFSTYQQLFVITMIAPNNGIHLLFQYIVRYLHINPYSKSSGKNRILTANVIKTDKCFINDAVMRHTRSSDLRIMQTANNLIVLSKQANWSYIVRCSLGRSLGLHEVSLQIRYNWTDCRTTRTGILGHVRTWPKIPVLVMRLGASTMVLIAYFSYGF